MSAPPTCADPSHPLQGVHIVDLTHVWSGPSATRLLASLGANVVKIEGPSHPDFLRGTGSADVRSRYPDLEHGADPWNRNAWFNTQNTDKRTITVDLKNPEGLEVLYALVARADLVISNYRAGVLERMGLGLDELRRHQPDIVVVEMTGYGSDNTMSGLPSYGAQFDAMSGSAWLTGNGTRPLLTGFALSDPVAGLSAACAAVTALARRRRGGGGGHVDVPQRDAMIPLMGEHVLAASQGRAPDPGLNAAEGGAPHGIFRLEDDDFLALGVTNQGSWEALLGVVDAATAGALRQLGDQVAARARSQQVDDLVAAWCSNQRGAAQLAARLQEAGVPAAPVQDAADLMSDPQLRWNGFFRRLRHRRTGEHEYPSAPFLVAGERPGPRSPAPVLDQDTDEVLRKMGGLDEELVQRLHARGAVGWQDDPMTTNRKG